MSDTELKIITRRNLAKHTHETLEEQIIRDPLTGAFNRRFLDKKLDELTRNNRNETFALIIFDIDHFKETNDTYGHLAGDGVLQEFVGILNSSIRVGVGDFVARYGGEEFAVVIKPTTDIETAAEIAERVRDKVEKYEFRIPQGRSKATVSAGVGLWDQKESKDKLIGRIDTALYLAKNKYDRNNIKRAL